MVPSAISSRRVSASSWRAMSEAADFRELVRRLVALAVFVVPVELAGLFVEGELVRAVAEGLVLRQSAAAEPLLLAIDHVGFGLVGGALYETCHAVLLSRHPLDGTERQGVPRRSVICRRPRTCRSPWRPSRRSGARGST